MLSWPNRITITRTLLIPVFVILILGGAGPPREVLTDPMRIIGDITPLSHVITLMQDPWLGFGWNNTELLIVLGFMAASVVLSARFFRWE